MSQHPTVAVLGLGAMGHAFAANLLKNGFTTFGWNRTRSRGEDLQHAGLHLTDSPEEAVKQADVVIAMLSDGDTTLDVFRQVKHALKQGAVVAQMGTIGVDATTTLIDLFSRERKDVVFLDAPVSGTKAPAENAQIVVLASGEREQAAAIEPVFAAISKGTKWLGAAGQATKMKLVVNAWLISMVQGLSESTQMAKAFGFTPDDLWAVLEGGPLAVPYVKGKLAMIAEGKYEPQMHLTWALKDVNLALAASKEINLPGLQQISGIWQQAVDAGYGQKDLAVVYRYLDKDN